MPNIDGSSEFTEIVTPASRKSRIGCSSSVATARVAMFDDGHTSSGMPFWARYSSSFGSCADDVPCPIRSAPSRRIASQTVSGPVVSPACGTLCSPTRRAASKCGLNCGRETPISGPPSPKPTSASTRLFVAKDRVASAAGMPLSPGMS